jgi:hypothetical protein
MRIINVSGSWINKMILTLNITPSIDPMDSLSDWSSLLTNPQKSEPLKNPARGELQYL